MDRQMMVRNVKAMAGVDPRLIALIWFSSVEFEKTQGWTAVVVEGVRTRLDQQRYLAEGKSASMNSKHLTGHAVDVALFDDRGAVTWDFAIYRDFADCVKSNAEYFGFAVTWGGDWPKLRDGPHFEVAPLS